VDRLLQCDQVGFEPLPRLLIDVCKSLMEMLAEHAARPRGRTPALVGQLEPNGTAVIEVANSP
jgi:hypothetical protein